MEDNKTKKKRKVVRKKKTSKKHDEQVQTLPQTKEENYKVALVAQYEVLIEFSTQLQQIYDGIEGVDEISTQERKTTQELKDRISEKVKNIEGIFQHNNIDASSIRNSYPDTLIVNKKVLIENSLLNSDIVMLEQKSAGADPHGFVIAGDKSAGIPNKYVKFKKIGEQLAVQSYPILDFIVFKALGENGPQVQVSTFNKNGSKYEYMVTDQVTNSKDIVAQDYSDSNTPEAIFEDFKKILKDKDKIDNGGRYGQALMDYGKITLTCIIFGVADNNARNILFNEETGKLTFIDPLQVLDSLIEYYDFNGINKKEDFLKIILKKPYELNLLDRKFDKKIQKDLLELPLQTQEEIFLRAMKDIANTISNIHQEMDINSNEEVKDFYDRAVESYTKIYNAAKEFGMEVPPLEIRKEHEVTTRSSEEITAEKSIEIGEDGKTKFPPSHQASFKDIEAHFFSSNEEQIPNIDLPVAKQKPIERAVNVDISASTRKKTDESTEVLTEELSTLSVGPGEQIRKVRSADDIRKIAASNICAIFRSKYGAELNGATIRALERQNGLQSSQCAPSLA